MRPNSVTRTVTTPVPTAGQRIADLNVGRCIVVGKIPMGGSLEARRLPAGAVQFYWRYTELAKTSRVPIGLYDSVAPPKSLKPTSADEHHEANKQRTKDLVAQYLSEHPHEGRSDAQPQP